MPVIEFSPLPHRQTSLYVSLQHPHPGSVIYRPPNLNTEHEFSLISFLSAFFDAPQCYIAIESLNANEIDSLLMTANAPASFKSKLSLTL